MSDLELMQRTFELVRKIRGVDNDALVDDLYFVLEEAFERLSPAAVWEERVRFILDESGSDPKQVAVELNGSREALDRRRRLRESRTHG